VQILSIKEKRVFNRLTTAALSPSQYVDKNISSSHCIVFGTKPSKRYPVSNPDMFAKYLRQPRRSKKINHVGRLSTYLADKYERTVYAQFI
jgi:UDP-galactopyranose mutase